jgi:formylglycine-generating enzyme required for sulfatase activity
MSVLVMPNARLSVTVATFATLALGCRASAPPPTATPIVATSPPPSPHKLRAHAIPGGSFKMGTDLATIPTLTHANERDDEQPLHEATVGDFWLDDTEVTVDAYSACVESGACKPSGTTYSDPQLLDGSPTDDTCNVAHPDRGAHPVNCVDWFQATDYCAWIGGRLPKEAEYEYAARGGAEYRDYPWGAALPDAEHTRAILEPTPDSSDPRLCTLPVGSLPKGAARWSQLDLAGNVAEWAANLREGPMGDPPDGGRAFCGGSFATGWPWYLGPAHRGINFPIYRSAEVGFRCAYDHAP